MPLKQIPTSKDNLEALENTLSNQLPESVKTLFTIQLHLRLGVNKGLALYRPDDQKDDTLVMLYPDTVPTGTAISIHCQNNPEKLQKVKILMEEFLDWRKPKMFHDIPCHTAQPMRELCHKYGTATFDEDFYEFVLEKPEDMPKGEDDLFPLKQKGIEVKPLDESHIPLLVSHWEYKDLIGEEHAKASLKHVGSNDLAFGTFVDGQLVSWALTYRTCVGMVNTLPDHRYQGHALRCVRALCQRLFSMGMTPFVHIGIENKISIRFFEKLGFRKSYTATYIVFSPS